MHFGFLLFDELEELDLIGPWEMINMWRRYANGPDCVTVAQEARAVECGLGLRILPDHTFDDCPTLDYLLIPGGWGTRRESTNEALLAFIRRKAESCERILSVCTGALLLHAAGVLAGRHATTHWKALPQLRELPDVVVEEERWVCSGNVWTAAGVSAGIDMALALIADLAGNDIAGEVQSMAEYYPDQRRYGRAELDPGAPAYLQRQYAESRA